MKKKLEFIFLVIATLVCWSGLGAQLWIMIAGADEAGTSVGISVARFFGYFTILTNILVAVCFTVLLFKPISDDGRFFSRPSVRTAIALYIVFVGIAYTLLLRQVWNPQGLQKTVDELLHTVTPLLFLFYWIFFTKKGTLRWRHAFVWLLYPLAFAVYALVRGEISGFYAYYFMNADQLGYGRTLLNVLALGIAFLLGGLLFITIDKLVGSAKRR